jgi:adenine-specific DNA-methyltransferase
MSQKYEKLKTLLKELFQLDQPDLDFGLYRVMHAKSAEVSQFLDKDLLPQVQAAFGQYKTADKAEIEKELAKAIEQAKGLGVDPETTQKVKDLRARLASDAVDIGALENEVYDHLFSFFRRYYSEGDFLAKRVYKPGVYAIPYEGEEVTLHWANKDQYYIKTSEYLRDYAFRLRPDDDKKPMRVHFRLVDAAEGEHGNVKAAEGKDRVFILEGPGESGRDFIAEEDGEQGKELVIRFEYRPATLTDWPDGAREGKSKPPAQKDLIALATKRMLAVTDAALSTWIAELGKPHITTSGERAEYSRLEAHLRRYTARNTFDYFIHKGLGAFLRRELDFYIKNEVMHLDDVENETAPRVEQYLSKIKVIRRIAVKIIDFLAQLEDFQKKLWLKKKFVVETQWCIRVGCIPEAFYPEIAANEAQRDEWVRLFAIDEIEGDLTTPAYSAPLTVAFLKAHPTLVVDTRYLDPSCADRLLEAMGEVGDHVDGLLIHGENFQALSLLQQDYREKVKCIYIDPPYNTGDDGFAYKDTYRHSSWMSMIYDRLDAALPLLGPGNLVFCSIDRDENRNLLPLMFALFGEDGFVEEIIWQKAYGGGSKTKWINSLHEYVPCFTSSPATLPFLELPADPEAQKYYKLTDDKIETRGRHRLQPLYSNSNDYRENLTYPIPCPAVEPTDDQKWREGWKEIRTLLATDRLQLRREAQEWRLVLVVDADEAQWTGGKITPEKQWQWSWERTRQALIDDEVVVERREGAWSVNYKQYQLTEAGSERGKKPPSILIGPYTQSGTQEVSDLFGYEATKFPKPTGLVRSLVGIDYKHNGAVILDYFAGSGTTGHAVINLNREDGGQRKFILVEVGDYFHTVLLPRIKKVTFTPEWKDGKPKRLATLEEAERSPHIVKVIRLESYEDALNNLETRRTDTQQLLLDAADAQGADGLKEQYLLRYMLDVETRGSQSLLNVQAFTDPTAYKLKVKRPGSDESREVNVDLQETFNWLIGLTVRHIAAPQSFSANFKRDDDPDLLKDAPRRLLLDGRFKLDPAGPWWFRTVTGTMPDGRKTLVIWRKLTGEPEQDNLVLDEWFTKHGYSAKDSEFHLIYVNGGNNLENLKTPDDTWKVRLIEEEFHRLMFDTEGV